MATTIRSTDLDFNNIKNSLKLYLQQSGQFDDYNFEASGLSSLLDVLAYNTHHNALLANFALNESYLPTAQLRSSLVSLAASLGYSVRSRTASFAVVNLWVTDTAAPATRTLPKGTSFTTTVDNKTYTFKTRDVMTATNDGFNRYYFALNGNINVPIYEGVSRTKTFIAGPVSENDTYVIPETTLDLDTIVVTVTNNNATSTYTNINKATSINTNSKIFTVKETPNGFYELTFSNGVRFGQYPVAGDRITVTYDIVSADQANGAITFTPTGTTSDGKTINISTVSISSGGNLKESADSIRKNAPYLYATQNRMVTAEDYSALILRNYSNVISDVKSWGGEDNVPPKYGTVYSSLVFNTEDATVQSRTKGEILNLAKALSVVSFDLEFVNPVETYLEVATVFQFNPNLTSLSQTQVESNVKQSMQAYFNDNLGNFDQSFRRSNMLTQVDDTDAAVLSSRASIKMQYRFVPRTGIDVYTINFPSAIASPDDNVPIIASTNFYLRGTVCKLRNRIGTNVLEVIDTTTGRSKIDNVGYYDTNSGVMYLSGFTPSLISGTYFKITAIPANQATINPLRNNILKYDASASTASAVLTDTV